MPERTVTANGIDIWTEDFGDPANPAVLLIMGATAQGILWPDEFCQALAAAGHHVIRYDNRDTGQSTTFDFAANPYTLGDMAADAVGVLDAYGIARAHIIGASMGGMITQAVAIEHPERVLTMTSIMSSPAGAGVAAGMSGEEGALPGPEPRLLEAMAQIGTAPAKDDAERIDRAVIMWRALSGPGEPFDEAAVREREARVLARAKDIDAVQNHSLAIAASADRTEALRQVTVPALIIHGDADPILPLAHGLATHEAMRGSKLLVIEGMGHELPPRAAARVMAAILEHIGAKAPVGQA